MDQRQISSLRWRGANRCPLIAPGRMGGLGEGGENAGSAIAQASQSGAPIDTVAVPGISNGDVRIEQISGPSAIWSGDHAGMTISINSPSLTTGKLQVNVDGQSLSETDVSLSAGIN